MDAFTLADLKELLATHLDAVLENVASTAGGNQETFYSVVRWADRQNRLEELIEAAHEVSANPKLAELYAALKDGSLRAQPWDWTKTRNGDFPFKRRHPGSIAADRPQDWVKLFRPPAHIRDAVSVRTEHCIVLGRVGCGKTAAMEFHAAECWPSPRSREFPVRFTADAITTLFDKCAHRIHSLDHSDFLAAIGQAAADAIGKADKRLPSHSGTSLDEHNRLRRLLSNRCKAVHQRGTTPPARRRPPADQELLTELCDYLRRSGFKECVVLVDGISEAAQELAAQAVTYLELLVPFVSALGVLKEPWIKLLLFLPEECESLLDHPRLRVPAGTERLKLTWTPDDLTEMLDNYVAVWASSQDPPAPIDRFELLCEAPRSSSESIVQQLVEEADGRPELALKLAGTMIARHCAASSGRERVSWQLWEDVKTTRAAALRAGFRSREDAIRDAVAGCHMALEHG